MCCKVPEWNFAAQTVQDYLSDFHTLQVFTFGGPSYVCDTCLQAGLAGKPTAGIRSVLYTTKFRLYVLLEYRKLIEYQSPERPVRCS